MRHIKRNIIVLFVVHLMLTLTMIIRVFRTPDNKPTIVQASSAPIVKTVEEPIPVMQFNDYETYELHKIAMAEAEGEGVEGKAHVMMVVLNRVADDRFPDTIHDVIFQKNQFTPISNGRYDRVVPDIECYKALQMIRYGWDESKGALYFESNKNENNWHSRNLQFLFKHGGHRFYK